MTEHKPYPSDLSDAQWALIEPVLTAWKAAHPSVSGHEGGYELREIVNAIRYQGRTGVQWDYLPHDLPPKSATYYYFSKWRDDGTDKTINVEIVERNPAGKGFVPQPKRWVVEQTYGILMSHRRLVRDYEHLPASSESRVYWAMTDVMSRRLTRGTAPPWRWT
ncbi:transposase [Nonomuraea sp. NPDC049637]|uniref:transposase n=1 Tax=Nonomuraea sp. NPDC049637 TaxID=3154356 RepID=UPI003434F774